MPTHHVFDFNDVSESARRKLTESLVLVHGGMAQNVGPILEMVTEKYLLRSEAEWRARQETLGILDEILAALRREDVPAVGAATWRNFTGPLQTIIPWASNFYTESLIDKARAEFSADFRGFWMLGGMSGGGMGFIFSPSRKAEAQERLQEIMSGTKRELEHALPFAMERRRNCWPARIPCCRGITTRWSSPNCSSSICARCRSRAARNWTNSPPPAIAGPN
jgi:hypothetical protein